MDIAGTKKKVQRLSKMVEKSYKKINEMLSRMQTVEEDLDRTSRQVDHIEYDLAQQRALLEALAAERGLDVEEVLDEAELPPEPGTEAGEQGDDPTRATSRPSAESR
jgi:septal ring factor EnvC (AmiA/AmiB activator)